MLVGGSSVSFVAHNIIILLNVAVSACDLLKIRLEVFLNFSHMYSIKKELHQNLRLRTVSSKLPGA